MAEVKILLVGYTSEEGGEETTQCTVSLVKDKDIVMIVDPGTMKDRQMLIDALAKEGLQINDVNYVCITHSHMDHIGALSDLRSGLKVPLGAHALDSGKLAEPPEIMLKDGDTITLGNLTLEVLHTPGHTPGSLCFRTGKYLISGDTLFPGGPGKSWSPGALKQMIDSITKKLFVLPDDTQVYPGHGETAV